MDRTRRRVLRIAGSALPLALAGCGEPADDGGGEDDGGGGDDGGADDGGEENGGDGAYRVDPARNDVGVAPD